MANVLHAVVAMDRGGAETFLMNVLRVKQDSDVYHFLCYGTAHFDYEDELLALGGKIIRVKPLAEVGPLRHIREISEAIREHSIDAVHAHSYYNSVFSLLAATMARVPVRVVHSHNTKSEDTASLWKRLYFGLSHLLIELCANRYVACGEAAGKALFFPWRKPQIIPNGIIAKNFLFDERARTAVRGEFNIPPDDLLALHVGRFEPQKNHDMLIAIFEEFAKEMPSSRLLLVGEGSLRSHIEAVVASKPSLAERVIFAGKRADMEAIYSAADVLLLPSLFEGFPVCLVEAQANGIPCLVSQEVDPAAKMQENLSFLPINAGPQPWVAPLSKIATSGGNRRSGYISPEFDSRVAATRMHALYEN